MSLRAQLEAIIYAAETPISLDQISSLVKESLLAETPGIDAAEMKSRLRATLEELIADYSGADHGIESAKSPADTACPPSPSSTTWCALSLRA